MGRRSLFCGFSIRNCFDHRKRSPGAFLFRRFWRIFPLYWILSFPFLLGEGLNSSRIAASLTLWPFWGNGFSYPYLLVAWTLCFEIVFYVAAAIALKIGKWMLFAYGFAAVIALLTKNELAGFIGNPMILEFLCGAAITRLSSNIRAIMLSLVLASLILLLAPNEQIGQLSAVAGFNSAGRVLMWGIPAILVVYAAVGSEKLLQRAKPLVTLGDASYSTYLIFGPLTATIAPVNPSAAFVLSLFAGLIVHKCLEKPLLALGKTVIMTKGTIRTTGIASQLPDHG